MGVPFGFSVGDLIAGIGVIKDGIKSLSDARGAKADYRSLSGTLDSLSQGLEALQELKLDPKQDSRQQSAIKQAVDRCRGSIDSFLERTGKYNVLESSPNAQDWKLKLRECNLKLKWAILKKDDVKKFQDDLHGQIETISLLQ
ncbi:hypothetical protein BDZ45DRAFT_775551 [Acephala macrosclerotiorum]|nr:hypothetical protein BDZ45DRAFT_775551 [Acephala macrosclerotiorum]